MYRIEVDPHTHSVISLHAYSTVEECARHAAERGLRGMAVTDHCSLIMAQREHSVEAISNQRVLPDEMYGVRVWKGVEIDIVDFEGRLAFEDRPDEFHPEKTGAELLLSSRDFVIASIHTPFDRDRGTVEQNTAMYLAVLRNPYVDVLGHTGRSRHAYELSPVLLEAKRLGKAIELNNSSLENSAAVSAKPCRAIAEACRDLGVPVTVSSDCHSAFGIGRFSAVERLLWELGFPEELIVNRTRESFEAFLEGRRRRLAALAGA